MAFITTTANSISSGGTISGDITIEGDLTVNGDGAGNYDEIINGNLVLSAGSKLGVGTGDSDPAYQVDVLSAGDGVVRVRSTANSSGNDAIFTAEVAGTSAGDPFIRFNIDNIGAWSLGADNSDSDKFKISGLSSVLGTNDRFVIDTSGNIQVDGNFGIGTSPHASRKLVVTSTNTTNANTALYTNAVHTGTGDDSVFSVRSDNNSASGAVVNIHNDGSGACLNINSNGSGHALIADGFVGIGLTDPNNHLMVGGSTSGGGDIAVANTDTTISDGNSLGSILFKGKDDSASSYGIGAKIVAICTEDWNEATSEGTSLNFYTTDNGSATNDLRMIINQNGEVFFGESAQGLSISGLTSGKGTITGINQALSAYKGLVFNALDHSFKISGTEQATIDSSGNLNLNERLTFSGTTTQATASINLNSNNYLYVVGGTTGLALTAETGIDAIKITDGGSSGAGKINFEVNNANRMVLDADSRVSLGNNDSSGATSNTIFGRLAGNAVASGAIDNVLIGNEAGNDITTGDYNVAIGANALEKEDVGRGSIAIGAVALGLQNTASEGSANNIGIGLNAGAYNVTGINNTLVGTNVAVGASGQSHSYNTAFGSSALNSVTTGGSNVGVGYFSLEGSTTGTQNVAVGSGASQALTTGLANVSMGFQTMLTPTTVQYSVAVGSESMRDIQAGQALTGVTAIGYASFKGGGSTTTGANYTTALGFESLKALTTGAGNTAVGSSAGNGITSGSYSTFVGYNTGLVHTTGGYNIAIGYGAMDDTNAGSNSLGSAENIFIGVDSGGGTWADTASSYNVAIGNYSMDSALNGATYNVGIGHNALTDLTTADATVAIGALCAENITTGAENTAVGTSAMRNSTTGSNNTAIGREAMGSGITTGDNNVAVGKNAGLAITSGSSNVAIGNNAMDELLDGERNIAIGHDAMGNVVGGTTSDGSSDNIFIGYQSGGGAWTDNVCSQNIGIGSYSLDGALDSADFNTTVGAYGLSNVSSGSNNTSLGRDSGTVITTGSNNTCIGYDAEPSANSASNQTVIGKGAVGQADNSVTLGNGDVTAVYMAQDSGATVHGAKPQWADSSKKYYKLIGSKSLTADTVTDFMVVGHSHSYNITFWADSSSDGVAGFHRSAAIYGSQSTSEIHETTYGSGTDNISISYLNSGGSQAYILRVTASSADCTFHYMIEGFGSQTLTAL